MFNKFWLNQQNSDVITIRKNIQYFPKIQSLYVNLRKLPDVQFRNFDVNKFFDWLSTTSLQVKNDSKNLTQILPIKPEMLYVINQPTIKLVSFVEHNVVKSFVKLQQEYTGFTFEQQLKNHSTNIWQQYDVSQISSVVNSSLVAVSIQPIISISVKQFLDNLLATVRLSKPISFTFVLKSLLQTHLFDNPVVFKVYLKVRSQQLKTIENQIVQIYDTIINKYANLNVYFGIYSFTNK